MMTFPIFPYRADEIGTYQIRLEHAWEFLGPGVEALFDFLGAVRIEEDGPIHIGSTLVRCDTCGRALYRTEGFRVLSLAAHERKDPLERTVRPIVLTVAGRVRLTLCSQHCAVDALLRATPEELVGGYPL